MDLNADVGEGFGVWRVGDDAALIPRVTSANIATGGHAGDPAIMWRTVELAKTCGVCIGAHIAYPDLRGFGRRAWVGHPREMVAELIAQIGALAAVCQAQGVALTHIKPHGALYHDINHDSRWQDVLFEVWERTGGALAVMAQANTPAVDRLTRRGVRVLREGFADRVYDAAGNLVSRDRPDAVHHDPERALAQALSLARDGRVQTVDGSELALQIDTLCIHGDTPGAADWALRIQQALLGAGVPVASYAQS